MKKNSPKKTETKAENTNNTPATETKADATAKFLYVNKVTQRYSKEDQQVHFRQEQGGYAAYDAEYKTLKLFISTLGSPIKDKNNIMSWRFSMSFKPEEIPVPGFVRVSSLRKYYGKEGQRYGYFRDNAGYATVAEGEKTNFLNIHVDSLPAMVIDKNGLLSYRFEIRLNEEKELEKPVTQPDTTDDVADDDIPF